MPKFKVEPIKINLKKLFGNDIKYSASFRNAVSQSFIDNIVKRTKSGRDKDKATFDEYSESYKNSKIFKQKKGTSTKVNLTLFNKMLQGIKHRPDKRSNAVATLFIKDSESAKAHGHINGGNFLPVRDFWGKDSVEKAVRKEFKDIVKSLREESEEAALNKLLKKALKSG